ncbi:MAG: hypothetical protein A4E30_00020 [Methanomassiliicoccales archaeon PtaB.Bin215]|nr:MAG: hypothetical protein A4E30_00020 [Methanomassiliicoccales archaeon PtaB.Bin215]
MAPTTGPPGYIFRTAGTELRAAHSMATSPPLACMPTSPSSARASPFLSRGMLMRSSLTHTTCREAPVALASSTAFLVAVRAGLEPSVASRITLSLPLERPLLRLRIFSNILAHLLGSNYIPRGTLGSIAKAGNERAYRSIFPLPRSPEPLADRAFKTPFVLTVADTTFVQKVRPGNPFL